MIVAVTLKHSSLLVHLFHSLFDILFFLFDTVLSTKPQSLVCGTSGLETP